jgi:ketosteroid isomerase-like protein
MPSQASPQDLARAMFDALLTKDRMAAEALLREDFTFISPYDEHIDRTAYFERCWPNSTQFKAFEIKFIAEQDDAAFVLYEAKTKSNETFRNTEHFITEGGRIKSVEVFFDNAPPPLAAKSRDEKRREEKRREEKKLVECGASFTNKLLATVPGICVGPDQHPIRICAGPTMTRLQMAP